MHDTKDGFSCDICQADLFCRFVTCPGCAEGKRDYCLACVSKLRGCQAHRLEMLELTPLEQLVQANDRAYALLTDVEGLALARDTTPPPSTVISVKTYRSDATVCALLISNNLRNSQQMCHQCKCSANLKRDAAGVTCYQCSSRFCSSCVYNRYQENFRDVLKTVFWECYRCRSKCNCALCRNSFRSQPFDTFSNRAIESIPRELLSLDDVNPPTLLKFGMGKAANVDDDYLVPPHIYPRNQKIESLKRHDLLLCRYKDGEYWPCVRALNSDESRYPECDMAQSPELLVFFFGKPKDAALGWVSASSMIVKPSPSDLARHAPPDPKNYDKARHASCVVRVCLSQIFRRHARWPERARGAISMRRTMRRKTTKQMTRVRRKKSLPRRKSLPLSRSAPAKAQCSWVRRRGPEMGETARQVSLRRRCLLWSRWACHSQSLRWP